MADVIIKDHSDEARRRLDAAIPVILEALGQFLEGEAALELEKNPRRVDTGRLRGSISHAVVGAGSDEPAVQIGTNVEYAIYVHDGTMRMAPNRFLKNSVTNNEDQIRQYIEREIKKALK